MIDSTADAANLLPCPCCNGTAELQVAAPRVTISCTQCALSISVKSSTNFNFHQHALIKRWNTRPQPAPPVEKQWDSEAGCMGTGAYVAVAAPPVGEPDFAEFAWNEWNARKDEPGLHLVTDVLREFGERMYRLALAARPKVWDAEVAAIVKRLDLRMVREPLSAGDDPDHPHMWPDEDCRAAVDLLEHQMVQLIQADAAHATDDPSISTAQALEWREEARKRHAVRRRQGKAPS